MRTTVVSALFDIGRDSWKYHSVDREGYLRWYRNTLSLNANHIIYTDEVFYDRIQEILKEVRTSPNVLIIKQKLEDLPAYKKYFHRLTELMSSEEFRPKIHFNVPEMLYPLYNVIMFNKMHFLEDAKSINPFDSEMFVWVDAGGLRENIDLYRGHEWPNPIKMAALPNDKIHTFCHHPKISIYRVTDHLVSQMRFIQGTAFYVPSACISPFIELFDKKVNESIASGHIGSDEKILDICYLEKPELFTLEVSSWREYYGRYL